MDLIKSAKDIVWANATTQEQLKEVFQNEALRKDTRWKYYLAYFSLNTDVTVGLPSGYYELARAAGLEPWQEQFTPPGHITTSVEIVSRWEQAGLDTVNLKDFFMETAITTMVITDE